MPAPARDVVAALAGAPLVLAFAPFGAFALAPLALAALFLCWEDASPRRAAFRGFLFGATGFLGGTYWLYISLHQFGGAPLFIAIPMMLGLVAVMAAWFALAGWLTVRLAPDAGAARWLLAAPGVWVLTEWLRGWFATGFPWFAWGYSQSDSPLAGLAPLLGVFGVSLAVALSAGVLAGLVRVRAAASRLLLLGLLGAVWGGSAALQQVAWSRPAGAPLAVALVQGGVPQDQKWLEEQRPRTMALYRELTDAHWDADLVVWPEAAIPALLNTVEDYFTSLFVAANRSDTALLIGAIQARGRVPNRAYYNSVIAFDGGRVAEYHKRHLVPFGEFYPVPDIVRRWMRDLGLPYSNFSRGPRGQPPLAVAGVEAAVSICYEDVFGAELLGPLPAAALLVNVSNDAWFGGSVAPHQHLQIARMRAMETRRPMLRATNSGISALIDHRGRVTGRTGLFQAVVLRGEVQPRAGATPYVRLGDAAVLVLAGVLAAAGAVAARLPGTAKP